MKKMKKFLVALIVFAGSFSSCNKIEDFKTINSNPNATTSPVTSALLTNVLAGLAGNVWGNAITMNGSLYAQYYSETQYTEASRYAIPTIDKGGYYSGPLEDLQNIINYNTDPATLEVAALNGSNANQIATARILKAYYYWVLTDSYGDIPYFEALKGDGALAYDEQSKIYPDLIKELKEAVDQFDGGDAFKGDILFPGTNSIAKWKKFANSIRLLMALRISAVDPATSQAEVASALSNPAGVIEDNADNASLAFPGGIYNHPIYQYYIITKRFDYAESKTLTDFTAATSDKRQAAWGTSTKGFPYGLTRDDAVTFANGNTDYAQVLAASRRTSSSPVVILGAADVWLARAEAIQRGWATGTVATAYSTGIQRSWEQWGVYNASDLATYIAQPSISLAADPLVKIQTQQWAAFYPNGTQGWSNYRRTGVPTLTPAPGTGLAIPVRIPYGPAEFQLNKVNADAASAKYTAAGVVNSQDAKVWWDN